MLQKHVVSLLDQEEGTKKRKKKIADDLQISYFDDSQYFKI